MRTRTPVTSHLRFSRKNSLSRMTTKIGNRFTGAVHRKIRKYKKLMAGEFELHVMAFPSMGDDDDFPNFFG